MLAFNGDWILTNLHQRRDDVHVLHIGDLERIEVNRGALGRLTVNLQSNLGWHRVFLF